MRGISNQFGAHLWLCCAMVAAGALGGMIGGILTGLIAPQIFNRVVEYPLLVVLTHPQERLLEYADDPRHARFLAEELWPKLEARFPLVHEPAMSA